jgi:UDP-2,3-diacylglucosamine hydrolase
MEKGLPISADRAVILSDAHLNQDDTHSRNFLALAEKAAAEGVPLFLLGDVFDLWFGTPGLTFGFQRPIIDRLRALRRGGLRLYYVEGNRDFYVKKDHEGSTFDAVSEGEMRATVGGRRLFLSHGDAVNRADLPYRFWKGISKNRLAYGGVARLPSSLILPLADRIEQRLRRSNRRYKGSFPEREARDFSLRLFGRGVDFVVLGHFHLERLMRFTQAESSKVLAVLPAWKEAWRYFYFDADGGYGFRTYRKDRPLL